MKATQDEFAKFIAQAILDIEHYSFDLLYDIKRIMDELAEKRSETREPQKSNYHLMLRNTGADLIKPDDENYKLYNNRSNIIYSLTFCWNCSYMMGESFCNIDKIM